jgi:hypothetical protein
MRVIINKDSVHILNKLDKEYLTWISAGSGGASAWSAYGAGTHNR